MASLFIFTLSTSEQLNAFYLGENGKLAIETLVQVMTERIAPIYEGRVTGEGFSTITVCSRENIKVIECACTAQSSLGYFYEARMIDGHVKSERMHHQYFSKSTLSITEDSQIVMKFDWAAEENAKTKIRELVESLGLKSTSFKLNDKLLRAIQNKYTWTSAKIDRIEKAGDSTKKVSYEIDPANKSIQSEVDQTYRQHGKISHISFELPYRSVTKHVNTPNTITVKLYSEGGNRIVIDENEFGSQEDFRNFQMYLLNDLSNIRREIGE